MFRVSIREMLILVALIATAIVSLKYANEVWLALIAGLTMILGFAAAIVAVIDRGPRQASATGFVLTLAGYAVSRGAKTARQNVLIRFAARCYPSRPWPTTIPTPICQTTRCCR